MNSFNKRVGIMMGVMVAVWASSIGAVIWGIVTVWPYVKDVLVNLAQ